ncbi:MAG: hypothetical protein KF866_01650 [Phycisphaeraceae bacterium]|nr:hypothetical protein [Phycisphaeraceae bacterium]MCW5754953.1 hypothetical protein [Phycisphaeraceae bacterium]
MAKPTFESPGPFGWEETEEGSLFGQRVEGAIGLFDENAWNIAPAVTMGEPELPTGPAAFTGVSREDVYRGAKERMGIGAHQIAQRGASLCGPAALMFITATHHPERYYTFATTLFEKGDASLGKLRIRPGKDCRAYNPSGKIAPVDWVTLAGIRDSENAFFDYDEVEDALAGITLPGELAEWFRKAGYGSVLNESNLYFTKSKGNFLEAVSLHNKGHRVCLFIDINGIVSESPGRGRLSQIFTSANHWVVLQDVMSTRDDHLVFSIYTWGEQGGEYRVPQNFAVKLKMDDWLMNYYGYVACRP